MRRLLVAAVILSVMAGFVFAGGQKESAQPAEPEENVLIMANAQDINNYNAFTQQYIAFEVLKYNVYETLLVFNAEGELEPVLATSIDQLDDTTYQINLRPNVVYHNGEPLLASDVEFTFDYILTQEEAAFYRPFISAIESMDVVDDLTLVVSLSAPSPSFLGGLTLFPIVKEGTEDQLDANPIGTGPFKFVEWQPNERTEFERFDDYWDEGKPYFDRFIMRPLTDPKIQVTNLEAGTVSLVKDLPVEEYPALSSNDEIELFTTESSNTTIVLEIGQKNHEALANPTALRALWYAMDRERINQSCFEGLGNVINGAYPSGTKYFDAGPAIDFDLDRARELLAEAGYPDGFSFTLDVLVGYPWASKAAQIWQAGLQQIGVDMTIDEMEASEWIEHYLARSYDIIMNWYSMPGVDPSAFDNTITTPLVQNAFATDPSEILALIEEGKTQLDGAEREQVYRQLQDVIMSEYPYFIPLEMPVLFGWRSNLKGVEVNSFQYLFLKNARFE